MTKAEGIWGCTVLGGRVGQRDGVPLVQIDVQLTDGPSAGSRGTYEDVVNAKTIKYVRWSAQAVGWQGKSWSTLESDIAAFVANGGKTTAEVKHLAIKKGKAYDKWAADGFKGPAPVWDKINGLGRGAAQPVDPISKSALADADALLAGFQDEGGTPPQDAPPVGDDDIPFITSARGAIGGWL